MARLPISALRRALQEEFRSLPPMTVSWRPERVDRDMAIMAGKNAYAGLVAPEDFLGVTSRESRINEILDETGPLDVERLSRLRNIWDQETPFLNFVETRHGPHKGKPLNSGHEGRHRTTALGRAGARRVPVLIRPQVDYYQGGTSRDWVPPESGNMRMLSDRFTGEWPARVTNLTPYTPENRDAILNLGGRSKNHLAYSLPILLSALAGALGGMKARESQGA